MRTAGYTIPCCVYNHLQTATALRTKYGDFAEIRPTASPLPFRTWKVHGTGGNRRLPLLIEADINDGVRTVDLSGSSGLNVLDVKKE